MPLGEDRELSDDEGGNSAHRIPVIDKMMAVLDLLEKHGPLGVQELTRLSSTSRSTVYRLLNTLVDHGMLSRAPGGHFRLGFRLVSLAALVDTTLTRSELIAAVHPYLERLADRTDETCKLSVLDGDMAEVVDVVLSPSGIAPSSRVGSRFALHAGAASKLLLAFAPASQLARVVGKGMAKLTPLTLISLDALQLDLERIRHDRMARDLGEWNANINAVAAPIRGVDGQVIGAISVTYFKGLDNSEVEKRIVGPLRDSVDAVSKLLGYHQAHAPAGEPIETEKRGRRASKTPAKKMIERAGSPS